MSVRGHGPTRAFDLEAAAAGGGRRHARPDLTGAPEFSLLAEHIEDMVSRLDLDGVRHYVSPGATILLGYEPCALVGTRPSDHAHPADVPLVEAAIADLAAGRQHRAVLRKRLRRRDDSFVWVEAALHLIRDPRSGAPQEILAIVRDISAQQAAEARRDETMASLSEANRSLTLAEQMAGVGHWRLDLATRRLLWSPELYRLFGFDPAAGPPTIAQFWAQHHPESRRIAQDRLETAISDGGGFDAQSSIIGPDGKIRHVELRAMVEHGADGMPVAVMGVARDVTEQMRHRALELSLRQSEMRHRRAAEASNAELDELARRLTAERDRAEEASRAKSRFLAGMSHELRTPLNGILGFAQMLQLQGLASQEQAQWVESMMAAGRHLMEVINTVLDLSQIEAERLSLHTVETDLLSLATTVFDIVSGGARAKGLDMRLIVSQEAPVRRAVDPVRLRQVLLNLLGNAVKYTASGAVELRLMPLPLPEGGVRLEVADTGPGVAPDARERLFHEFEVTDAGRAHGGTGLGLAISARLVGLMGGRIGHVARESGGSIFWVELPGDPEPMPSDGGDEDVMMPARPLHVLVADDVDMNRAVIGAFLRSAGHRVTSVADGEAAVRAAATQDLDVVLMDLRMPGVDGLEASRRIRALGGSRGNVPILALTAQVLGDQIARCRNAGMNGFIAKPVDRPLLLKSVAQAALEREAATADDAGAVLPVLDRVTFDDLAIYLSGAELARHLGTLRDDAEALLASAEATGAEATGAEAATVAPQTIAAAHRLAGSAGMYGLPLAAFAARQLELRPGPESMAALAAALRPTIEALKREIAAIA